MAPYRKPASAFQAAAESRTYSWLWKLSTVGPALILIVSGLDLHWYLDDPASYPIGWEGGGWKYSTHWKFVISTCVDIVIMASLLLFLFCRWSRLVQMTGQIGCLLVSGYMIFNFLWLGLAVLGWKLGVQIPPPTG